MRGLAAARPPVVVIWRQYSCWKQEMLAARSRTAAAATVARWQWPKAQPPMGRIRRPAPRANANLTGCYSRQSKWTQRQAGMAYEDSVTTSSRAFIDCVTDCRSLTQNRRHSGLVPHGGRAHGLSSVGDNGSVQEFADLVPEGLCPSPTWARASA